MRRAASATVLVMVALAATGCRRGPRVKATAAQKADVVEVNVDADILADVTVRGEQALHYEPTRFAATSFPLGKQTVEVVATRRGKTTKIQVPFERTAVAPSLKVKGKSGSGGWNCRGFCEGSVKADDDGKLELEVTAPAGAKVEIAGEKIDVDLDGSSAMKVDLAKSALDVPLDAALASKGAPPTVDLPARVTTDSTVEGTVGLPATVFARAVYAAGWEIEKGPIAPDGSATPRAPKSLLRLGGTSDSKDYFGKPGLRLRDVDLVAATKWTKRTGDDCGPYTNVGMIPHVMHDKEVVVYDRRTGQVRTRRTFAAATWCPETVMADKETYNGITISETATAETYGSEAAIEQWLRSLVGAWK